MTSVQSNQACSHIKTLNDIFEKSNFNLIALEKLLVELQSIKEKISIGNIDPINEIVLYNVMYSGISNEILSNTSQIELFLENTSTVTSTLSQDLDSVTPIDNTVEESIIPETEIIESPISVLETDMLEDAPVLFDLADEVASDTEAQVEISSTEIINTVEAAEDRCTSEYKFLENTLIISETEGRVVLPYKLDELKEVLENNTKKYNSIEDVISDLYTKPLKYYKKPSISRFREAFRLIKERENGTFGEALDIAIELLSNHSLHPAIITACKTLDELDIYLSCLEYNELEDFRFFKVVFNALPAVRTKGEILGSKLSSKKQEHFDSKHIQ